MKKFLGRRIRRKQIVRAPEETDIIRENDPISLEDRNSKMYIYIILTILILIVMFGVQWVSKGAVNDMKQKYPQVIECGPF